MDGLLGVFFRITNQWYSVLPQTRTLNNALFLSISLICALGRKTITRAISAGGKDQLDWTLFYRFFSRSPWDHRDLFNPILKEVLPLISEDVIAIGFDDTLVKKTGTKIPGTSWQRDPLGPKFLTQFAWGMRYLQGSILLPLYNKDNLPCRAIPVSFSQLIKLKKPSKKAPEWKHKMYEGKLKLYNSSTAFVEMLTNLRERIDHIGYTNKKIVAVVDGSYCNQTCFRHGLQNVTLVGRVRKNSRLYFPVSGQGKRRYSEESFTPDEVRQSDKHKYKETKIHFAGDWYEVKYKELKNVCWKNGTKSMLMRLIVIAPTGYRKKHGCKKRYRDPGYLLTNDMDLDIKTIIQKYFDRWQIEVNFKEEKSLMGLGDAQVWSNKSVEKAPAFVASTYAALVLSSVILYGDKRQNLKHIYPKWRNKPSKRPSCLDLMTQMRIEVHRSRFLEQKLGMKTDFEGFVTKSAA
jgi:hypothetical protein